MALIKCSECGKEISDSAVTCPNCGCKTTRGRETEDAKTVMRMNRTVNLVCIVLEVVGAILFFPGISELHDRGYNFFFDSWARSSRDYVVAAGTKATIGIVLAAIGFVGSIVYSKFIHSINTQYSAPANTRKCPHCGEATTSDVCGMCGKSIHSAPEKPPTWKRIQQEQDNDSCWICSGCGRKNLATRTTCWNCNRHV